MAAPQAQHSGAAAGNLGSTQSTPSPNLSLGSPSSSPIQECCGFLLAPLVVSTATPLPYPPPRCTNGSAWGPRDLPHPPAPDCSASPLAPSPLKPNPLRQLRLSQAVSSRASLLATSAAPYLVSATEHPPHPRAHHCAQRGHHPRPDRPSDGQDSPSPQASASLPPLPSLTHPCMTLPNP